MTRVTQVGTVPESVVRRSVVATAIGNGVEWMDFTVYGFVAGWIGAAFFPGDSPSLQVVASFAAFASSYLVRPLGGLFFGSLGDRFGRQRVLATTVLLMALATALNGVIPGYATAGPFAVVLLIACRLLQGFSAGGEYGGAATYLAEFAPDRRRGFYCSFLEFGTLCGSGLSMSMVLGLDIVLGPAAMAEWGWRIPFLVAGAFGVVGLYLRLRLEDTPAFRALVSEGDLPRAPLREAVTGAVRPILLCMGLVLVYNVLNYTVGAYLPTYLSRTVGFGERAALVVMLGTLLVMLAVITGVGALSDRIGRKPLLIAACGGVVLLAYPAFLLMSSGFLVAVVVGVLILALLLVTMLGTMSATLPSLFPTRVRYSGFSIAFNVCTSVFAGTSPLAMAGLTEATGSAAAPAYYLIAAGLVSFVPILLVRESSGRPLPGSGALLATPRER
ncbi:MFS transporter [Pseudonocardia acaciae]|uniref:MFS transporter n=1 Tax=Pseudonocardia acaciae TaxID=551276 RepID=UPI0006887C61|nr:MFS transporter [Pseudonocardia acaciae]